jgi:translocation and assembly module TamA
VRTISQIVRGALVALFAVVTAGRVLSAPRAQITGDMDSALRQEISQAVGETKTPPQNALDARRRARGAAADATALLRSEGYYDSQVDADITPGEPPRPILRITPGPRFHIQDAAVDWVGDPPAQAAAQAAVKALSIPPGAPGRAADVVSAEGRVVAELHKRGYADSESRPREVVVDYADQTVRPTFKIEAGELVHLGAVTLKSKGRSRSDWVKGLARWKPGEAYSPDKIAKLEQALDDTGVYDSVTVAIAPRNQDVNGLRPVIVSLSDRKPHTIEFGATYSTTQGTGVDPVGQSLGAQSNLQGSGADAKWIFYNRLGRGDTFTVSGYLYDIQQKLDIQESLPDWGRPDQILRFGGLLARDQTPAYNDSGGGLRAEVERHWTKTTFVTVGGGVVYESTFEKAAVNPSGEVVGETLNLFVASTLGAIALDRSNNVLNPTRGWRLELRGEPTLITGDRDLVYLKVQSQVSGYLPLDRSANTVIAARIKFGELAGGTIPNVPADQRFYSGGGGSVRGYGYQLVGPRLSNNTPEGGASLAEASLEVRQQVASRWGVVAFADAGAVGTGPTPSLDGAGLGVGLGVRYDLGFGPLRLDIATPLRRQPGDSRVQIYISIGQSF